MKLFLTRNKRFVAPAAVVAVALLAWGAFVALSGASRAYRAYEADTSANRTERLQEKRQAAAKKITAAMSGAPANGNKNNKQNKNKKAIIAASQPAAPTAPVAPMLSQVRASLPPQLERQRARDEPTVKADVKIVSGFECSATLGVERVTDTHYKVKFTGKRGSLDNYFLFRVEGVAGKTVRIDFEGAPLWKWWSLNPVYSYVTDLGDPANFQSEPVADSRPPVKAHNGPLLPDTRGEKWHFMPNVWSKNRAAKGTLSMVHTFEADAYVALNVPYTPSMNNKWIEDLKVNDRCKVIHVGMSKQKQQLYAISIGDSNDLSVPGVLIYAREHGTESSSSWIARGAVEFLLSDDSAAVSLRKRYHYTIIPVLDPDAASSSTYNGMTKTFDHEVAQIESISYAKFFGQEISKGTLYDFILNLHNIESSESKFHIFTPFLTSNQDGLLAGKFNQSLKSNSNNNAFTVGDVPSSENRPIWRLGGWASDVFDAIHCLYEVNAQNSVRHLSNYEARGVGKLIVLAAEKSLKSPEFKQRLLSNRARFAKLQKLYSKRLDIFDEDSKIFLSFREILSINRENSERN